LRSADIGRTEEDSATRTLPRVRASAQARAASLTLFPARNQLTGHPFRAPADSFATPRVAAGALFCAGDRLMLVRKTYGNGWDIPGGYAEDGESPAAACRREVKEELNLDREPEELQDLPSDGHEVEAMAITDSDRIRWCRAASLRRSPILWSGLSVSMMSLLWACRSVVDMFPRATSPTAGPAIPLVAASLALPADIGSRNDYMSTTKCLHAHRALCDPTPEADSACVVDPGEEGGRRHGITDSARGGSYLPPSAGGQAHGHVKLCETQRAGS
jgi:NUDIX domain